MDFKLRNAVTALDMIDIVKDSATVISEWVMVTVDWSNEAVEADATSTVLAYAPFGAWVGETTVKIVKADAEYLWTLVNNFALAQAWTTVDMAISSGKQVVDNAHSVTDVFKISIASDAWTVGSKNNVVFRINKPLY